MSKVAAKRLLVDRLHCLQDTPEWSGDEVYLLVVIASSQTRPYLRAITVAPARSWQGLTRTDGRREEDVTVDAEYASHKLYVAALLEQDGERDFDIAHLRQALQQRLDETYRMFGSMRNISAVEISREISNELNRAIAELRHDDEAIGDAFALPLEPGAESGQVFLTAPDRRYRIWFKLA
jgi:hypothetical protein